MSTPPSEPSDTEPACPHGGSQRPWVSLYGELPTTITDPHATGLDMARTACLRRLDEPLLHYFGTTLTGRQVAGDSDALACALAKRGVGPGDRVESHCTCRTSRSSRSP